MPSVGQNVSRKDGIGKATGRAQYADDLVFPGMLHGRTIRSTIPHGRIRSISITLDIHSGFRTADHDESARGIFDRTGLTIVDHRDVPGRNVVALIEADQPFLAERDVLHQAEPILLLAHENVETLNAAKGDIEYDVLEPVFDPEKSEGVLKRDRKSTRLNSSHLGISYAVFCLK